VSESSWNELVRDVIRAWQADADRRPTTEEDR